MGWKKEARPAVKDNAGLEDERGRIRLRRWQCIPKVFHKKLLSVQLCPAWLEVCWKPPSLHHPCSALLEQPNCCKSQNLLLLSNGRGIHLKGLFRRGSQITSNISTYFKDLFVLASEIPVRNEHLMAESLIIFLNSFMAAFPIWKYMCVLE